jgi:uncharacterized repeat protein (TIGR04138 family)
MTVRHSGLAEVIRRDPRYAIEAYEFLYEALGFTQRRLGRQPKKSEEPDPKNHVSGRELLEGVRELALREFGLMARTVLKCWGIHKTDDFGEIVFNLVEAGLMSKTPEDTRADFQNVYNLDDALMRQYEIKLDEQD